MELTELVTDTWDKFKEKFSDEPPIVEKIDFVSSILKVKSEKIFCENILCYLEYFNKNAFRKTILNISSFCDGRSSLSPQYFNKIYTQFITLQISVLPDIIENLIKAIQAPEINKDKQPAKKTVTEAPRPVETPHKANQGEYAGPESQNPNLLKNYDCAGQWQEEDTGCNNIKDPCPVMEQCKEKSSCFGNPKEGLKCHKCEIKQQCKETRSEK